MKTELLCGSACVKYILDKFNLKYNNFNYKMKWATELALYLLKYDSLDIEVRCFNSNLYDNYLKNITNTKIISEFEGFLFIKKLEEKNKIINTKLTKKELKYELNNNDYIILCVESAKFNKSEKMSGGHFIILNSIDNDIIKIINPIKDRFEYKQENIKDIINYTKKFGFWRILIKEVS